ncbi:MAG: lysophospholipid acyltransferase family protein [Schleiferiaceae bacterium]|nr:lysophospholipid acyltransferase family protein [Schleiferiaceae bacterium]
MGYSLPEARAYCRENFYLLAQNLLDRMAFALGLGQKIKYTQKGEQTLVDWAQKKEGGLLFSGHIGNWAIAGNLLKDLDVKVNVLMLDNEHERLKEFLKSQQRQPQFNVIPIKEDLSHLVEIYKAVKRGELVCINADRFIEGAKTIDVSFLNKTIKLPEGPFILAKKLKVKYTFVFAVKSGKFDYHFSSTPPVHATSDEKKIAQDFANELEVVVKEYPQQWFNYYDVFNA